MTNFLTYNYYFMKQNDQLKQPFFARFLESQSAAKVNPHNNSLRPPFTLKFLDDFEVAIMKTTGMFFSIPARRCTILKK
jgi:hypothetical protein